MDSNSHTSGGHRPPSLPAARQRRNWLASSFVLLLLSPFVAGLVWYIVVRASNSSAITRLENEARQRGEPLTLIELQFYYTQTPIPDADNAAISLLSLWENDEPEFWKAFREGNRHLPERKQKEYDPVLPVFGSSARHIERAESLDAESLAKARDYLQKNADHLDAVRAALRKPQSRFPLALTNGAVLLLPHLTALRWETQNFRLAELVATDEGNTDQAIEAVRDTARVGQLTSDEPVLISHLVRIACMSIALSGAEHLLSRQALSLRQLEKLKAVIEETKTTGGLTRSLIGERAMGLSAFDMKDQSAAHFANSSGGEGDLGDENRGERIALGGMKAVGLAAADRRLMLETFQAALTNTDEDTPEALTRIEQAFQNAAVEAHRFPPKIFSRMLLPSLSRAADKFYAFEAKRRAALTAVTIEEYRLQHAGKPPAQLDELVPQFLPAVPTDPFDGQSLRYKILEKGYVVYSIGADRSDDGGKERKPKAINQRIDETFTVERQP